MKKLVSVFLFLIVFSSVNKAQSLYCGGICIISLSVGNISDSVPVLETRDSIQSITGTDTVLTYWTYTDYFRWLKINMYGVHDSAYLTLPILVVVDSAGDTIANKQLQSYNYYQYIDSVTTDSVLTKLYAMPANFKGYVSIIDGNTGDTCKFGFPMDCSKTAINELSAKNNELTIFPNPASSDINISISNLNHQQALIKLYDDTGQLARTYSTSNSLLTIESEGLSNGIYFISADIGNARLKTKLIISK